MRSVLTSLVLTALLTASAVAQGDATQGPPPTPVRVAEATQESLSPRKKVFGELRASKRSVLAAEEGGIVREIVVREGGHAAAGEIVARLDDRRVKLEIAANAAAHEAAEATVVEREAAVGREERQIALLKRAEQSGGTNPREMADAESALSIARAQLAQAKAALSVIEAQGALLAKRLSDLEVRAPYAGAVTKLHADQGAWIADGGPVADFVGTDAFDGWFDVPQELFGAANELVAESEKKTQRAVPIDIQSTAGAAVIAVGLRVVPEIDPRSRTFHAVARIMKREEPLADGLALVAFVPQGPAQPWTLVPKDALIYQGTSASLYIVKDGAAVPVQVRVAFPIGDRVALDGAPLPAGAQVVVEGNERLIPMSKVAPVGGEAK